MNVVTRRRKLSERYKKWSCRSWFIGLIYEKLGLDIFKREIIQFLAINRVLTVWGETFGIWFVWTEDKSFSSRFAQFRNFVWLSVLLQVLDRRARKQENFIFVRLPRNVLICLCRIGCSVLFEGLESKRCFIFFVQPGSLFWLVRVASGIWFDEIKNEKK